MGAAAGVQTSAAPDCGGPTGVWGPAQDLPLADLFKIQSVFLAESGSIDSSDCSQSSSVVLPPSEFVSLLARVATARTMSVKHQWEGISGNASGSFQSVLAFLLNESKGKESDCVEGIPVSWCEMEVTVPVPPGPGDGFDKDDILGASVDHMRAAEEEFAANQSDDEDGGGGGVVLNQLTLVREACAEPEPDVGVRTRDFVLGTVLGGRPGAVAAHSIVMSNNGLGNCVVTGAGSDEATRLDAPRCLMVSLAANPLRSWSLQDSLRYCPDSLLVLDLSYCVCGGAADGDGLGLALFAGCFLSCPQLVRLVLDGCGLTSTMSFCYPRPAAGRSDNPPKDVPAPTAAVHSVVAPPVAAPANSRGVSKAPAQGAGAAGTGMAALKARPKPKPKPAPAAAPNPLAAAPSAEAVMPASLPVPTPVEPVGPVLSTMSVFCGLLCLSELSLVDNRLGSGHALLEGLLGAGLMGGKSLRELRAVAIAENPCTEQTASYSSLKEQLYAAFPALESVDGYPRELVVKASSGLARGVNRDSNSHNTSSDLNLANEKEFLCALTGERDTTVVA